jgi:microtubule-associated protein-like 6
MNDVVIGTNEGDLLLFRGESVLSSHDKAHEKAAVNALWATPEGDVVVSGGKDGKVIIWAKMPDALIRLANFNVFNCATSGTLASLRSICLSRDRSAILVGTQQCEIIELRRVDMKAEGVAAESCTEKAVLTIEALTQEAKANVSPMPFLDPAHSDVFGRALVTGHYSGELWGLAVNPVAPEYCTVGDDGNLRIWCAKSRRLLKCVDMKAVARCCAYSPDGTMIAVGFGKGKVKEDGILRIYRRANEEVTPVYESKEAKQWVGDIKFSKDGRLLALGAHDNSIYVYSVQQQFKRKAKFSKHNSYITHFDFSADGRYVLLLYAIFLSLFVLCY